MTQEQQFEPIDKAEFDAHRNRARHHRGKSPSEMGKRVRALQPQQGFRTTCTWTHYAPRRSCGGALLALYNARHMGFRMRTSCHDKVLCVWRDA